METISVRMDEDELSTLSRTLAENRSTVVRELLLEGRKMKAIELYKTRKTSLGLSARISGLSLSAFLELLREFNVESNVDLVDMQEALRTARKIKM